MDRERSEVGDQQDEALEPEPDRMVDPRRAGTAPDGMTEDDVAERSELGTFIGRGYPLSASELVDKAVEQHAPDHVLARLRSLDGGPYESLQEVWRALGGGTEEHRS